MAKRKIIKIDEEKCTGCGLCVPNCAEGAIKIIDGKARLVSELLCDGLGACLGHCPNGAITIEEREAAPFSEKEIAKKHPRGLSGCPGSKVLNLGRLAQNTPQPAGAHLKREPQLANWPVQIRLVPANAPYFKDADILVAADCVPFAYPEFHEKLLKGKVLLVGCPKLDDMELYKEKMAEIVKNNDIRSVTYARMEVPCCAGLTGAIQEAIQCSGKNVPFKESVISIRGEQLK